MKNLTDDAIGEIIDLVRGFHESESANGKGFRIALLAYQMLDGGFEIATTADICAYIRLAARIDGVMPHRDEPRFSMADYADAYLNSRLTISRNKLMDLSDDDFAEAMIRLAADKRETYEDKPHKQDKPELGIFAETGR